MAIDFDSDDENRDAGLFDDPADYYPTPPKPTTEKHTMQSGQEITVRLVGHNPLWGHHLWQAGRVISMYIESNASLVSGKSILELGAGAGLPSLVSCILGAKEVVVTDYPDPDLVQNLKDNIESLRDLPQMGKLNNRLVAEGYVWGADPEKLLAHLHPSRERAAEEVPKPTDPKFDVLILADLLFNHSEHTKLVSTIQSTLSHAPGSKALVFFSPYRPWLYEKDLDFFRICTEEGLFVQKVLEEKMEKVMFDDDKGDEELRRTVFGYFVTWDEK